MLKRVLLIAFLVTINLLGYAQKVKPVEYGGGIALLEVVDQKNMILKLRVLGYGKNDALAQEDAEVRAIRAVMYAGVGEYRPIFASEAQTEAQRGDFLNSFFERKQYKDYLSNVESAGGLMKEKGLKVKKKPFDITVNMGGLERFMRTSNVKKRMGF